MKMKFLKTEIQVGGKIALETKQQQKCSAKKNFWQETQKLEINFVRMAKMQFYSRLPKFD